MSLAIASEPDDIGRRTMRTLRVLGLAEDGESLVCGDQHSGELFAIPTDDRLRAGARGDLSRLGQLEIEMEPQLRPREIQSRIRAGASIEEVAAAACTSIGRIERYAYPVLLERSTMAEKARYACGVIDGNPTKRSLDELVTAALAVRGQAAGVMWDAYRDEDGWLLALRWQARAPPRCARKTMPHARSSIPARGRCARSTRPRTRCHRFRRSNRHPKSRPGQSRRSQLRPRTPRWPSARIQRPVRICLLYTS